MRASGIGGVTAAVIAWLTSDPTLTALVGPRVYDEPPIGVARPYVRVSVRSESADDTLGLAGVDAIVEVLLVSDYRGDKQIGEIATAVRSRLELAPLTIAGFTRPADVTYEQGLDGFVQDISGVPVRHRPLWFRVQVT